MQEITEFNIEKTTAEILILKEQTAQNIIEIGKRLIKAKENLGHGEYLKWLEGSVDFGIRTAQNFIRVATTFSNTQPISHLGTRKLLALAGLDEEDRQEVIENNDIEHMKARELEQVVKEKKEIKKQLEAEQEYSEELQQAIKEKEQQINQLKEEIDNIHKPETQIIEKEVVKEVIPEDIILEKQALEKEILDMQNKLNQVQQKAEKAESALRTIKLEDNLKKDEVFDTAKLDMLLFNIRDFLDKNSKFTYLKEDLQNIPSKKKKFVEKGVNSIKEWVMLMEQALDNREDVVGNIIYGEGEIINE